MGCDHINSTLFMSFMSSNFKLSDFIISKVFQLWSFCSVPLSEVRSHSDQGKSAAIQSILRYADFLWMHVSNYQTLWRHIGKPVVVDDKSHW